MSRAAWPYTVGVSVSCVGALGASTEGKNLL